MTFDTSFRIIILMIRFSPSTHAGTRSTAMSFHCPTADTSSGHCIGGTVASRADRLPCARGYNMQEMRVCGAEGESV